VKLTNFEIESPFGGRTLRGLGHAWDLHNFATFAGVLYDPTSRHAVLDWYVQTDVSNPWGSPGNDARGCRLHFKAVEFALLKQAGAGRLTPENACLSAVSRVDPSDVEYRHKQQWTATDPFRLLFEFEGGCTIEIASDTVELEILTGQVRGGCGCPPVLDGGDEVSPK